MCADAPGTSRAEGRRGPRSDGPLGDDPRAFDWYWLEQDDERSWRWSGPNPRPRLLLPFTHAGPVRVSLQIDAVATEDVRESLKVLVDRRRVDVQVHREEGAPGMVVEFAATLRGDRPSVVELQMNRTVPVAEFSPGSGDLRRLGLCLGGIRLEPMTTSAPVWKSRLMTASQHHDPALDLTFERVVDVAAARLWAGWTDPELIVQWFTPAPWVTTEAEVEAWPGGIFRTVMRGPDGERNEGSGCVLEAVPGERLVWTNALERGFRPVPTPSAPDFHFTATIELEPVSGGTRYRATVRHSSAADAHAHAEMGFEPGWNAALDQLVALVGDR